MDSMSNYKRSVLGGFAVLLGAASNGHAQAGDGAPGGDVYARGLALARAAAVPLAQRPKRFVVADNFLGPNAADERALENGLEMMALLGMNTIDAKNFGALDSEVATRARKHGLTRTWRAVYKPLNGIDKEGAFFGWSNSARNTATVSKWARGQGDLVRKVRRPLEDVSLFHMADEPGWYYPSTFEVMTSTPARADLFHEFLRSKGLAPQDVGAISWGQVRPIGASQAVDLPSRRLFYWSVRYTTESLSDGLKIWTQSLKREFGPQVRTTSNWNNIPSRWYIASPGAKHGNNTSTGPDAATGLSDWMDVGRKRAVTALWSEDWFDDRHAQLWGITADALRAAALEGHRSDGAGVTANAASTSSPTASALGVARFKAVDADDAAPETGGFVVGLRLSSEWGARQKALTLLSRGAKTLHWYTWGPHEKFTNGYSENRAAYAAIASANRLIGRSEDLLYPGRRPQARAAILLPGSAYAWDRSSQTPLYLHELKSLYLALLNNNHPIDFLDEESVSRGDLSSRGYRMLFVTAPNVSARAQGQMLSWIRAGGTAVFSPGAAAADEYNTPTRVLDEARGLRSQPLGRYEVNEQLTARREIAFDDADWGASFRASRPIAPLEVSDATVVARSAGVPVLAHKRFRQGWSVSYGFWGGSNYFDAATPGYGPTARGANAGLTRAVLAAPRLTRLPKPVETGVEGVEAARLESEQGIAIPLFNWTKEARQDVSVTIRDAGAVRSVGSAEQGTLEFSREGADIRVRVLLRDVDVLLLRR
jgi:hypothetical protein